jgi:predicted aspartyl protease
MANQNKITWPYTYAPFLGIQLSNPAGKVYPLTGESVEIIDTGFDGDVLLPNAIYNQLEFHKYEYPQPGTAELADGSGMPLRVARGHLTIPKLKLGPFAIEVYTAGDMAQDSAEILIGTGFVKNFRLLLDGPMGEVSIL